MNKCIRAMLVAVLPIVAAVEASAAACDYRPSQLLTSAGTGAVIAGGVGVAGAGAAAKAAGFYTLTHAVTGATMLGSTAGGASAAGTVGIMGGTAGAIGTVGAIITAPATIVGAVVVAVGTAGFEGACYYVFDERITGYDEVLAIMQKLHTHADNEYFRLGEYTGRSRGAVIRIKTGDKYEIYMVEDLYIVNGVLRHSVWGPDDVIGNIGFIEATTAQGEGD